MTIQGIYNWAERTKEDHASGCCLTAAKILHWIQNTVSEVLSFAPAGLRLPLIFRGA
jgi:hypothetical protein